MKLLGNCFFNPTAPIENAGLNATLEIPEEVTAGSEFPVSWKGPDNQGDYITVVQKDAEEEGYLDYDYTSNGSPANVKAPEISGVAEIRYITGQSGKIAKSRHIEVSQN